MYIPVGFPQRLRYPRQTGEGDSKSASGTTDESSKDGRSDQGLGASSTAASSTAASSTAASSTAAYSTAASSKVNGESLAAASAAEATSTTSFRSVVANSIKTLFLCTSSQEIALWKFRPQVLITCYRQKAKSAKASGSFESLVDWKPDSTHFVVATQGGFLLIFKAQIEATRGGSVKNLCVQKDSKKQGLKRESAELLVDDAIPVISIFESIRLRIGLNEAVVDGVVEKDSSSSSFSSSPSLTALLAVREEIFVASADGKIRSLTWSGQITAVVDLQNLTFSSTIIHDPHHHHSHSNHHHHHQSGSKINSSSSSSFYTPGLEVNVIEERDHVTDMALCPLMGGLAIVLHSGHAFLMRTPNARLDETVYCSLVPEVNDATSISINHQHRLMTVGCRSGVARAFIVEESSGLLKLSHQFLLRHDDFPPECSSSAHRGLGGVSVMRWTPDGCCLALAWEGGGFSLWSVFGGLFHTSFGGSGWDEQQSFMAKIGSMEWGLEAFDLWMLAKEGANKETQLLTLAMAKSASTMNPCLSQHQHVFLVSSDKLFLNSVDFLGQNLPSAPAPTKPGASSSSSSSKTSTRATSSTTTNILNHHYSSLLQVNKQWLVVPMPSAYLATNWPPRCAAVNDNGSLLAISGQNGFCHYSLATRRWKLFGNEAQEKDFAVSGGMFWWQDYLCVSAYNAVNDQDEIRFYPRTANLDNAHASVHPIDTPALLLNHVNRQNSENLSSSSLSSSSGILLVFGLDFRILLYSFSVSSSSSSSSSSSADTGISSSSSSPSSALPSSEEQSVSLTKMIQVSVENYVPHPSCVVGAYLSPFRVDDPTTTKKTTTSKKVKGRNSDSRRFSIDDYAQSLLLNICGKLLLFQCEENLAAAAATNSSSSSSPSRDAESPAPFTFAAPVIIASCVENVWIPPRNNQRLSSKKQIFISSSQKQQQQQQQQQKPQRRSHLLESLWLGCGHVGLKLWLPLNPSGSRSSVVDAEREDMFVSKRIIMTIPTQVYPLAILYEEGLIVGCVSRLTSLSSSSLSPPPPLWSVERKTQLYLPQILLYLLRQNLGRVGLKIVRPLQHLPYFNHVLELLLHEVLEEEGCNDSDEPLPDALLPKVLVFIKEFTRSSLQTIAHCARKTEMTLWPHLFAAVGSPTSLFDECLNRGDPETAASYLLILQNLEQPTQSFHFATKLLNVVLDTKRWDLANDLVRFMKAINPSDLEETSPSDINNKSGKSPWSSPNEGLSATSTSIPPTSSSSIGVISTIPLAGAMSGGFPMAPTVSHCYASAALPARSPSPPALQPAGVVATSTGAQAIFDRRSSSMDFSNVLVASNNNNELDAAVAEHPQMQQQNSRPSSRRHPSETTKLGRPKSRPGSLTIDTDLVANHHKFVENLLISHARFLLADYRIRDLGTFAAHISPEDFQLLTWLKNCGAEDLVIEDYVQALSQMHRDFDWPLPNYSHTAFVNILRRTPSSAALFPQSQSEPNIASGSTTSGPSSRFPGDETSRHPPAAASDPTRPQSAILVSAHASLTAMNQVLLAHSQSASASSKSSIGNGVGGVNDQAPERSKTVVVDSDSGTFCGGGSGSGAGGFVDSPLCRPDDSIDASSSFQNNSTFPFSSDSTIIPSSHSHMSANSMPPQTPLQHSHINDMPPQTPLLHAPDQFGSHTMEAFLRPQLPRDVSVNTALTSTDFSEESSSLMTDDGNGCLQNGHSYVEGSVSMLQASELYQLSQELSQKGPSQSELELRYLYQICLEAGLLGWCFLIAVLLHDGFSVIRIINPSRMEELGTSGVANLRRGLETLNQWAESGKCPGYKPFLTALKIHTSGIFNGGVGGVVGGVGKSNNNNNAVPSPLPSSEDAQSKLTTSKINRNVAKFHLDDAEEDSDPDPRRLVRASPTPIRASNASPTIVGRVTPVADSTSRPTSESDQSLDVSTSKKNASASSTSTTTTRSRSSTPIPPPSSSSTTASRRRDDRCASPELAFTLMPSPDDVLMTSATSSRGFSIDDDDNDHDDGNDDLNGNRLEEEEDLRANVVALNISENEG